MSSRPFYLTTTLPYVNADPHIGFALEVVQADAFARMKRLQGDEVFYFLGTDEHGQKIFQAAEKNGKDVKEYVDFYAEEVQKLVQALDLQIDARWRTTDPAHKAAAQEMWKRCAAAGDIYKKTYTGTYCVGCEAYKTAKDLTEEGKCVIHPNLSPETISEENYFFRYSKYQKDLLEYLENADCVIPEWRRQEAINFVKEGLEDFSISRDKSRLSWGVPVPGDDTQVMYVWFDALTSYLSVLGWPDDTEGTFKKFWVGGTTVQMAGKDQVRFQSLMWQAMLFSAGIKNTDQIFYHGFINSGGQRMSKSLGNVISPYELVKKYGTDATRYLLLRHVHPMDDSDVTWEKLDEWYTAHLTNGLGNLVARVMKLAEEHIGDIPLEVGAPQLQTQAVESLDRFEFNAAMNTIWDFIQSLDQKIHTEEPFKLIKIDREGGKKSIIELRSSLFRIGYWLSPFMPETSERIMAAVKENKKPENLFPRL
jgi:methionyl-tRNA synthetase